jgi:protein O-GlcNAc transferase
LSDADLATAVREDGIDVLVDLTMHMAENRLLAFARKPAPVQVSWLAYPGTTGLSAIDYRLSDPHLDPPDGDLTVYSERTLHLPDTFWCYSPLVSYEGDNPLPARETGRVRFGSLNNFCKVNDSVIALWAKVLHRVADSSLVAMVPVGESSTRTLAEFARHGIGPERLELVPKVSRLSYLARYKSIDVVLDTFPYNGHTTSLDALWMGVPVVTLVGPTVVGRAGLSQAMNLGMPELVARTPDEYVAIAAELAGDLDKLATLRAALPSRMEKSPLMDGARFARGMETAFRMAWRRWCSEP